MSGSHCLWILIDQFDITRHSKRRCPPLQSDCPYMALVSHNLHSISKAIKIWMAWSKDCMLKKICHLLIYIDKTTAIIEQEASFEKKMNFCVIWPKHFLVIWGFVNHLGRNVQKLVEWERQISQRIFHTLAASDTKYRPPIYLGTKKHEL